MSGITIREASPKWAKPLIGLYAQSGAGKTYTALLLARGFVGPAGKIVMIETESGRGEAYSDPAEYPEIGGYSVISLHEDFSPKTYGAAISAAEKAKADALIIDSGSHEWEGAGGVLAMAAKNTGRGILKWQEAKVDHKTQFILKLTQTPIPLVLVCMRGKYPMEKGKDKDGKEEWVRSTVLTPIQDQEILFEMMIHGWIDQDHNWHGTRYTTRGMHDVFKRDEGKHLTKETGSRLAEWSKGVNAAGEPISDDWIEKAKQVEEDLRAAVDYAQLQAVGQKASSAIAGFPQAERERIGDIWNELARKLKGPKT